MFREVNYLRFRASKSVGTLCRRNELREYIMTDQYQWVRSSGGDILVVDSADGLGKGL